MEIVTGKPMMIPCPTYEREGVNLRIQLQNPFTALSTDHHIQFAARLVPKGKLRMSKRGIA
jgi:hypothetical protein